MHTTLLLLGSLTATAQGPQQPVYRCQGSRGETVFSGVPCRDREDLQVRDGTGGIGPPGTATGHCADSPEAVREGVASAFDSGNVNELARLFLWRGYRSRAAYRVMARLQVMLRQPLSGLSLVPPADTQWWNQDADMPANAGDLRIEMAVPGMGDSHQVRTFPLVQRDGCYWLQYLDSEDSDFP